MANLKLMPDSPWPGKPVDPYVRLAVAMAETEPDQAVQLGSEHGVIELLLELKAATPQTLLNELEVPTAYKGCRHVTATMSCEDPNALRGRIAALRQQVLRLKLAVRQQPRLVESLRDMGPGDPPWGKVGNDDLDGRGIVIGVIDDGCAFAHRNFLKEFKTGDNKPAFKTRLLCLWDQTGKTDKKGGWVDKPADFGYGSELGRAEIDRVIAGNVSDTGVINEDKIYEAIDYTVEPNAHGTHVLDIAAGNSESSGGARGVAPAADIIFVQIPRTAIGHPADSALSSYILDGIMYIFARAGGRPAVVNVSYGGYGGPHDGTSLVERGIDELLEKADNRAVVVSAGNSFNADCHASGNIKQKTSKSLTWIVGEDDPTINLLEIWYNQNAELSVTLTPPDGVALAAVPVNGAFSIRQADGLIVGWVFHRTGDSGNDANHVVIALRPTEAASKDRNVAPAPFGHWKVQLANVGPVEADFHAWIERDDAGSRKLGFRLQSKFAPADASPRCTLGSLATGMLTVSVGAHNTATQEVCEYSACGPTRDGRSKPDVCAPAEEDGSGDGVLSASALSSQPTPMNGTSAAAPHVAGLVALMFQLADKKPLSAATIIKALRGEDEKKGTEASGRELKPNSRWPAEYAEIVADCIGSGKVNAKQTLDYLRKHLNP